MMSSFISPFDLLKKNASTYFRMYQPKQTNIVRMEQTDILSLVQSKGFEMVNNQVPNSIAKAHKAADLGSRLDTRA